MVSRSAIRYSVGQLLSAFLLLVLGSCQPPKTDRQTVADTVITEDSVNQSAITRDETPAALFDWQTWMGLLMEKVNDSIGTAAVPNPELLSWKRLERFSSGDAYDNLHMRLQEGTFFSYDACSPAYYGEMLIKKGYGDTMFFTLDLLNASDSRSYVILKIDRWIDDHLLHHDFEVREEYNTEGPFYKFRLSEIDTEAQFSPYWKARINVFRFEDISSDSIGRDEEQFLPMYFAIVPGVESDQLPYSHFVPDCPSSEN